MLKKIKEEILDINKDIDRLNLLKKEYREYSKESGDVAGPFFMILSIGKEIKALNTKKEELKEAAASLVYKEIISINYKLIDLTAKEELLMKDKAELRRSLEHLTRL